MKPVKLGRDQLRALNNPIRAGVVTNLRAFGEATARELAERVGIEERLLYYHLNLLVSAGLVLKVGLRPTSTKPETVYSVAGPGLADDIDLDDVENRRELKRNVVTVALTAAKEYGAAIDGLGNGAHEACTLSRTVVGLSPEDQRELVARLNDLRTWLVAHDTGCSPKLCVTALVTPLANLDGAFS